MNGIMLRFIRATRPHKATLVVDLGVEEASLSAMDWQADPF